MNTAAWLDAERCLPRRSGLRPRERCWRLVAAAPRCRQVFEALRFCVCPPSSWFPRDLVPTFRFHAPSSATSSSPQAAIRLSSGFVGPVPLREAPWTVVFAAEAINDLLPGLRHLAIDHAVYWFLPRAEQREVQVLAVFFGDKITSAGCWCACCKTAPRADLRRPGATQPWAIARALDPHRVTSHLGSVADRTGPLALSADRRWPAYDVSLHRC